MKSTFRYLAAAVVLHTGSAAAMAASPECCVSIECCLKMLGCC